MKYYYHLQTETPHLNGAETGINVSPGHKVVPATEMEVNPPREAGPLLFLSHSSSLPRRNRPIQFGFPTKLYIIRICTGELKIYPGSHRITKKSYDNFPLCFIYSNPL